MQALARNDAPRKSIGTVLRRTPGYRSLAPFHTALIGGIEERLAEVDVRLLVHIVTDEAEETATYERWAAAGTVGTVFVYDLVPDDPRIALCRSLGFQIALLGEYPRDDVTTIDVDNDAAMALAVDFLLSLGHTVIGRVAGPSHLFHTATRTRAFDAHVSAAGATGHTAQGDYSAASGAASLRELLALEDAPTAIMFDNEVMALGGLEEARALGLAVPGDVSLLAWDDSPECQLAKPALSVVSRDIRGLGAEAAEILLQPEPARVVRAQGALIVPRGSTAPPRVVVAGA